MVYSIYISLSFITFPANSILLWSANKCDIKNININSDNHKLNKHHLQQTCITQTEQLLKQKRKQNQISEVQNRTVQGFVTVPSVLPESCNKVNPYFPVSFKPI